MGEEPTTRRLPGQARRLRRRLRRLPVELAPPRQTVFRWLRTGPHGDVALGGHPTGLHRQPVAQVSVGTAVTVGDHVDLHLGPRGRVEIGDGVVLGNHVQIAADELVRIGAGCRLGDYAVLTDTWTYGRDAAEVSGPPPEPVVLGDGVVLGARSIVGPGARLPADGRVEVGGLCFAGLLDEPTGQSS